MDATDATTAEIDQGITIHYLRPGHEIIHPDNVEKVGEKLGTGVYKISPDMVLKFGWFKNVVEAKTMQFIAENTSIPVPKVHAIYTHGPIKKNWFGEETEFTDTCILMELVPGATLEDMWPHYDDAVKSTLCNELKGFVNQLKQLPAVDYIGSLDKGPMPDAVFGSPDVYKGSFGPFDSEEDLNIALRNAYLAYGGDKEPIISRRMDGMLRVHKHGIKFAHADLHPGNIIVKDGHISGIIDWGFAGWYPDYWEYTGAMRIGHYPNDWFALVEEAIGPHYCEFAIITKVRDATLG